MDPLGSVKKKRKYNYTKKTGRPSKLNPDLALKIFFLARKGLTDKEIAQVFDIAPDTITKWKKSEEFFLSLKENKGQADAIVERSLFERACGYEHEEDEIFCNAQGKVTTVRIIKHYPPDPTSMIFWLKNRQPDNWREKVEIDHGINDELLEKFKDMNAEELITRQRALAQTLLGAGGNNARN